MSYYFNAQIRIKDKTEYQKYIDKSGEVFNKYKSRYLAVDNEPVRLEGKWNHQPRSRIFGIFKQVESIYFIYYEKILDFSDCICHGFAILSIPA
ncbi:MAG: DUF1330 domain-containing protein [Bacteroidales bacterium]|nr:DUF1330 domain-containing protein [Bacteroidales bacterium]